MPINPFLIYGVLVTTSSMVTQFFNKRERDAAAKASTQERRRNAELAAQSAIENREHQIRLADRHRDDALELERIRQSLPIRNRYWPLKMEPRAYAAIGMGEARQPLVVAYLPPKLPDGTLAEQFAKENASELREFLMRSGYGSNDHIRPVRFSTASTEGADAEAALETLYHEAPRVPTALIQLDQIGTDLSLMAGCFGFAPQGMTSPPVLAGSGRVAWSPLAVEALKAELEKLRAARAAAPNYAFDPALLGPQGFLNLELLELEEASGQQLDGLFRPSAANLQLAARVAQPGLNMLAAGMADFFHWTRHGAPPRLPAALPMMLEQFPDALREDLTQSILAQYVETYAQLAAATSNDAPLVTLTLAQSLLPTKDIGGQKCIDDLIERAIDAFRQTNTIRPNTPLEDVARGPCNAQQRQFFNSLASVRREMGDDDGAKVIEQPIGFGAYREAMRQLGNAQGFVNE
jgi:hypothetical protein